MKNQELPKIAYIGWTEPSNVSGATLVLMRHLFGDNRWNVFVVTDKTFKGIGEENKWFSIKRSWLHKRLSRTRFRRIIAQYEMLLEPYLITLKLIKLVESFEPDIIVTIPDNTLSWVAQLIAKKLNIPLVSNFQDWWPRGQFYTPCEAPYLLTRKILENRFRQIYKDSKIAFCTSEGFRDFLGKHNCNPILYPCPGEKPSKRPPINYIQTNEPIRLIYAGTTVRYYGQKILSLARLIANRQDITFHIYGGKPDWSKEDIKWAEDAGIYQGFVKHEVVKQHIANAHIGLVVMTSAPELEIMMRTSFTTKFLEYTQLAKPVIVWGPTYCEPVRIVKQTMAGLAITQEDPDAVISSLSNFRNNETLQSFSDNSWKAANTIFDAKHIQDVFSSNIDQLISTKNLRLEA